ncbi:hypothetical protein [Teredinibacter haidensis]|uniref:hypothetical protein n=1 Tax=Teredinibacter haidensis TaxID=2731755 RepID=UPI000A66F2F9|nr:hypothetical protein [Teredinibacter haidensis]
MFVFSCFASAGSLAYEPYLNIGATYYSISYDTKNSTYDATKNTGSGYHLGFGIRNTFGSDNQHLLGTGIDIDQIDNQKLLGYRALDYQYKLNTNIRFGGFIGAASWNTGLPQNGYLTGINASYLPLSDKFDVMFEVRYASGLARDRLLEDDPENTNPYSPQPDIFAVIMSSSLIINWRFQ